MSSELVARLRQLATVEVNPKDIPEPADLTIDEGVLNALWTLKAGFQETDALEELGDEGAALKSIEKVRTKIVEFSAQYGSVLLVIDLEREADVRYARLLAVIEDKWLHGIALNRDNALLLLDENTAGLAAEYCPKAFDRFLEDIGRLYITPFVELEISHVDAVEGGFNITRGTPISLMDFLHMGAVLVTSLGTSSLGPRIGRRYSRYLVDKLVHASLPKLLPDSREELAVVSARIDSTELDSALHTVGWSQGREVGEFFLRLEDEWARAREATYLDGLRDLLRGTISFVKNPNDMVDVPEADIDADKKADWDWDPDNEEDNINPELIDKKSKNGDGWDWDSDEEAVEGEVNRPDFTVSSASIEADPTLKSVNALDTTKTISNPSSTGDAKESNDDSPETKLAQLVDLIDRHSAELPGTDSELCALIRALAPLHYGQNELLLQNHLLQLSQHFSAESAKSLTALAERQLGLALHRYTTEIDEYLAGLDLGINPDLEAAVKLRDHVSAIAAEVSYQSLFSSTMREVILSNIVEQIAASSVEIIEAMPQIGALQSELLSSTLASLEALSAYFEDVVQAVPSWIKMVRLRELLSANMAEIRRMLETAQLVDFSADELVKLITALFEDSERRRTVIREVYQALP